MKAKFQRIFYISVTLLFVLIACRREFNVPPEIRVFATKSIPLGICIEFEVIDENFAYSRVYVNDSLLKTYNLDQVVDTIGNVVPWNHYRIKIVAVDEGGLTSIKEVGLVFGPPPVVNNPYPGEVFWQGESVNFIWEPVSNATGYHLQVSRTYDFSSILVDTVVSVSHFTGSFLDYGYLYFRIRSLKDTLRGDWSDVTAFRFESISPPALLYPMNATFWVDDTVTFAWSLKEGAEFYRFQISADSNFVNIIVDSLLNTTSTIWPSAGQIGSFFWRVKAGRGSIWTGWTTAGAFDIAIPSAPNFIIPPDGSSFWNSEGITFSWTSVRGASSYNLEISANSAFTQIVTSVYVSGTTYNWTPGSNIGTLYSRVKAVRGNRTTLPSNVISIISINSTPVLISPSDGAEFWNAETLLFRWNSVPLASNYRLQVSKASDFNVTSLDVTLSDTYYRCIPTNINGGAFWRVRAEKSGVSGFYSSVRTLLLYPYEVSSFAPYNILGFEASGNYVYMTRNVGSDFIPNGALLILNVSNAASPYVAGEYIAQYSWPTKFTDIFVSGNYAYVVDSIWGSGYLMLSILHL